MCRGIPRANYMPYPFQIVQGQSDILFVYEYASSNRIVHMSSHTEAPVDSWMGGRRQVGGDTLVIEVNGFNDESWFDRAGNHHKRGAEGDRALHDRRERTSSTTEARSRIRRPSRGRGRSGCRSTAGSSRTRSSWSSSAWNSPRSCSTGI